MLTEFNKSLGSDKQEVRNPWDLNDYFKGICLVSTNQGDQAVALGSTLGKIYFSECSQDSLSFDTKEGISFSSPKKICTLANSESDKLLIAADTTGGIHIFMT